MKTEADFLPMPLEFREIRDRLRVVGYELVRYTRAHAQTEAKKYRHHFADYEYAIHKIESIQAKTGQIYVNDNASYASAVRVPEWAAYHIEKEKPEGFGIVNRWFKDPAYAILTVVVPPYGLTMLGLAAAGDRMQRKEQENRKKSLALLSEMPLFLKGHGS